MDSALITSEKETKSEAIKVLNEEPNNKIFSEFDNMDPLEYFSRFLDISEMILHHLNEDLIKISEVNPSYYNFIASSKALMENIKIVFKRNSVLLPEDIDLLKNSSRLYQSIEVRRQFDSDKVFDEDYVTTSELAFFYEKTHEWKNVLLNDAYFRTADDLYNLMLSIESSVESFQHVRHKNRKQSFCDASFRITNVEPLEGPKFPKLKHLRLFNLFVSNVANGYVRLFLNCVTIEEIEFEENICATNIHFYSKMLTHFDKITSLTIRSAYIQAFLDNKFFPFSQFQFKLKNLTIISKSKLELGINFKNFLKSQSDLEKVSIKYYSQQKEVFNLIMKLPKLQHLCFFDSPLSFSVDEIPEVSTTITQLTIDYNVDNATFNFMMKAMPNVTKLSIATIDKEKVEILKSMNKKFQEFRFIHLDHRFRLKKGVDWTEGIEFFVDFELHLKKIGFDFELYRKGLK